MDNLQGSGPDFGVSNPQSNVQSSGLQTPSQNGQSTPLNQSSLLSPNTTLRVEACTQSCPVPTAPSATANNHSALPFLGIGILLAAVAVVAIFVGKVLSS